MNAELHQDSRRHAEAAKWVARMQRPDAERFRADLDAWLAADRAHLVAYNKASERFHDARILSQSGNWQPTRPMQRSRRSSWPLVVASAVAVMAISGIWLTTSETPLRKGSGEQAAIGPAQQIARADNFHKSIVRTNLPDGTRATLDTDSKMRLMFSDRGRDIWLERGRVRFAVAHEQRPFIVHAGDGTITATGTLFDVAIDEKGRVRVTLFQGGVDVRPHVKAESPPFRLKAGQMLHIAGTALPASVSLLDKHERGWVDGMKEFDAAPLSEVIAAANRYGARPLRIESSDLAEIPISGRFRIDAPDRLAENLASSLGLAVQRHASGEIYLRRKISSAP